MVWAGISLQPRAELYMIAGSVLNSDRYINEILKHFIVPYASFVHLLYMHDNTRPHTANVMQNFLEKIGIEQFNWPTDSHDRPGLG